LEALEHRAELLVVPADERGGDPLLHRERDELLLRSVVDVALEPSSRARPGPRRSAGGRRGAPRSGGRSEGRGRPAPRGHRRGRARWRSRARRGACGSRAHERLAEMADPDGRCLGSGVADRGITN
jgi:hypothetical protein